MLPEVQWNLFFLCESKNCKLLVWNNRNLWCSHMLWKHLQDKGNNVALCRHAFK